MDSIPGTWGGLPKGLSRGVTGSEKCFLFSNCELYRVRALFLLVGKCGQRAVLACGVGEPGSR